MFYDKLGPALVPGQTAQHSETLPFALTDFLEAGAPPVVFTLGSSAVTQPGSFYGESIQAVRKLGRRAILLSGALTASDLGVAGDSSIFVASYAPYSALLPRAAATVHQGGIGTTAQALRSGRPMLIVPWAHDPPDNGERSRRLGVARVLERARYTGARAAKELRPLLESASYRIEAARVGARISSENGLARACETIEAVLA